jgi:hypothetical protein
MCLTHPEKHSVLKIKMASMRKKDVKTCHSRQNIDVVFFFFPDKIGGTQKTKTD